jgi:hypothetical protein
MPHVGNAISNVDLITGWVGPPCPAGFCFLTLDEATGDIVVQYRDSGGTPRAAVIGNYAPGNVARYGGGAPATVLRTGYYFQVNEAKNEVDFYYNDSSGISHGPIPVSSYGLGGLAIYTKTAPSTIVNTDSWFVVDESTGILYWYYQDSTGGSHGPVELATYGTTGAWTTYTPTWSVSSGGVVNSIQGNYIQTAKTVSLQILGNWLISGSVGTTLTYTIGLPVPAWTGGAPQFIFPTWGNLSVIARMYQCSTTYMDTFTVLADVIGTGTVFFRFNGVYRTN